MTRMQRPVVVWLDEGPALDGEAERDRVVFDVADGAADFVRVVEEDLPDAAAAPHRDARGLGARMSHSRKRLKSLSWSAISSARCLCLRINR